MIGHGLERIDAAVGERLERGMRAHHRRRLSRLGWEGALNPSGAGLWAAGEPAPREGNDVDVLIDGHQALPQIARAVDGARSHVHVAGWHVQPSFALQRDERLRTVRDVLGEAAERVDVRVLAWAGAPLPVFHPTRTEVREARDALCRGTRIRCALDARERPLHCHHEKLVIIDGELAFVGGIDLSALGGDRFDAPFHPDRDTLGWHDAACRLRGPVVADVAAHFAMRWREVSGEQLAAGDCSERQGRRTVQVVRTVPSTAYRSLPRGDFRILEAYVRALRSAGRLIYLENQFLWSPEIVAVLRDKLRHPPRDDFRLVVVLPVKPNNGADSTRGQLAALKDADAGAGRLVASTIYTGPATDALPTYVHAKIGIVDDTWLTLGSANLNERSLFNDTEMNVVCCDAELARAVRLRLWGEHLDAEPGDLDGPAADVIDQRWKPISHEQAERRRAGEPPTHRLTDIPAVSRRTDRLRGPLRQLVVDG